MMTLSFNHKNKTIEMPTKKYAASAAKYGTDEYIEVQNARRDYPTYKVVTRNRKIEKKDTLKGLTYEVMEDYISKHDSKDEIKKHYDFLRGRTEEMPCSAPYGKVKKWFLETYTNYGKYPQTSTTIAQ